MRNFNKDSRLMITILILIGILAIGYATLGANLKINGVAEVPASSWNVQFKTGSINVTEGSVPIEENTSQKAATIDSADQVSYQVRLPLPGDFYEFTVVVENTGSIDAMIDSISSKLGNTEITTGTLPSYLDYKVTYSDGVAIAPHHLLASNTEETYKVRLEFKKDITANDLPATDETLNLNFQINYVQADDTAVAKPVLSFDEDTSWDTIIAAVKSGNTSNFTVGSTKTVDIGSLGTHTLRVANNSTPAECSTEGFSQTACGFVLEFSDIITTHQMNPYKFNDDTPDGVNNKGGWEYSEMRTYVNTDIYNALPTSLKNAIINTTVVSGYGDNDTTNFTTTDKLYLLSTKEVGFDEIYDTAKAETRILDYYSANNNDSTRIKQNNGSNSVWWLRSADSGSYYLFLGVEGSGLNNYYRSSDTRGVAPAFRIA